MDFTAVCDDCREEIPLVEIDYETAEAPDWELYHVWVEFHDCLGEYDAQTEE